MIELCEVAIEVRNALDEGRIEDAKRIAIKNLRAGFHSQPFADVIAEMLGAKPRKGENGRSRRKYPPGWLDIGHDFQRLQKSGLTYEEAREQLAKKYGKSERTIETVRAFFKKSDDVFWKLFERSYRNNNNSWEE